MRKEFYQQFNNLMGDSIGLPGLGFGSSGDKNLLSPIQRKSNNNNPIALQDKERELLMKELQLENEELKRIVEQMKMDMETVVQEVKLQRNKQGN